MDQNCTLVTKFGTHLKGLGVHPEMPDVVYVETGGGYRTSVLASGLVPSVETQSWLARAREEAAADRARSGTAEPMTLAGAAG